MSVFSQYTSQEMMQYICYCCIYAFSENGKQLASANIKLQDGEYYALDESRNYYIAGARANDNLLTIQGKQSSFHLLDDPHYSGSTAICFEKGITYSSMNGNMDEKMSEGSHDIQIVDGTIYDIKTAFPEFDYDTTTITQFASQTLKKRGRAMLHVKRLPN